VPLSKSGRFVAAIAVHSTTARKWTPHEVELVQLVASRCWESIERARVMRVVRTGEEQLRLIMASVKDHAIFTLNVEGRVTAWGVGAERVFGYTAQEMIGQPLAKLFTPDDQKRGRPQVEIGLASDTGLADDTRYHRRKDGSQFFSSGTMEALRDEAGILHGFVKVIRDITEQKRLETQREALLQNERTARAEAERIGRLKDEFLATLSHELRTPLNAILGWAHLLLRQPPAPEAIAQGLAVIDRNARMQARLIADLLDMSRIISGQMRLDVQQVELPVVIQAALDSVRPAASAKDVKLHTVLDAVTTAVHGDPARLQQIVWNLVSNAVKFTPRGGRVQVILSRVNSHVEISVSDTGKGIPSDFLPHVFERFRQADSSTTREHGGLGLGLAIVKQLVELHGGTVNAASEGEGKGSTFTVHLPLIAIQMNPGPSIKDSYRLAMDASPSGDLPSLAGIRVLVVEDEPDAQVLIKRILEDCDATVVLAASAQEGLAAASRETLHVIVSDIGLPGGDGYHFMSTLRKSGNRVPAAALTAFARSQDRTRALQAGYQTHIAKPVEPAELLAAVAALAHR